MPLPSSAYSVILSGAGRSQPKLPAQSKDPTNVCATVNNGKAFSPRTSMAANATASKEFAATPSGRALFCSFMPLPSSAYSVILSGAGSSQPELPAQSKDPANVCATVNNGKAFSPRTSMASQKKKAAGEPLCFDPVTCFLFTCL
jgi:hypothetical protein